MATYRLCVVLGLHMALACSVAAQDAPARMAARSVTVRCIREPLRDVVPKLGELTGMRLQVATELREQKVIVIVKDRPALEVMDTIARVLGCQWVEVGKGEHARYRLERSASTAAWLALYARERAASEQIAREEASRFARANMDDMLSHVGDASWSSDEGTYDRGLAKFLSTLPGAALDRVAQYMADITPARPGGTRESGAAPVSFSFGDLSPEQREALQAWLAGRSREPGDYASRLLNLLPGCGLSITSTDGVGVDLQISPPEDWPGTPTFAAFGAATSPGKLAQIAGDELGRRLGAQPTPPDALLGDKVGRDGKPEHAVRFADPTLAARGIDLAVREPQRWQLLVAIADTLGLQVVADHYTLSDRLTVLGTDLGETLRYASDKFGTIFRQDGVYLMARRAMWPTDDRYEIPSPQPERWIATKEAGNPLRFEDLAEMASVELSRLDVLSVYRDRGVSFERELGPLRSQPRLRAVLAAFDRIPPSDKELVRAPEGLPLSRLSLAVRNRMLNDIPSADTMRSHLHIEAGDPVGGLPVTRLVLMWPGSSRAPRELVKVIGVQ